MHPTPVHARACETRSNYRVTHFCKPTLSLELAIIQQPSAVRPATGPTNCVAHPSIRGFKQPCRPPRYWPDELPSPTQAFAAEQCC